MKYLKTYENWWENKIEGYVVNGLYFLGGFKEHMFLDLSDNMKEDLEKILSDVSNKYKDEMLVPLVGVWMFGPFAAKYHIWVPAYIFQVACKTKDGAIKVGEELVKEFKSFNEQPICIAIAGDEVSINYKDPWNNDGSAYVISGRYIDNPKNCQNMIKKGISTIVL